MNNIQVIIIDVNSVLYMPIKHNRHVTIEWLEQLCREYIRNIQANALMINGNPVKFVFVFDNQTHEYKWNT